MQKILSLFSHPTVKKLDRELEKIFVNAPHLPKKIVDILVKIVPYLTLISGLFLITGGLRSVFGAKNFYSDFDLWKDIPSIYFYIIGLLQILAGAISVTAYRPLRDKKMDGWMALFCLTILELFMNIISILFLNNGIFGLLLGLLISFYFLYELKANYLGGDIQNSNKDSLSKKVKTKTKKK